MNEDKKVVYLTDYINKQESITTFPQQYEPVDLSNPPSLLIKRGIALVLDVLVISVLNIAVHGAYAVYVNKFLAPLSYASKMSLMDANLKVSASIYLALLFGYFFYTNYIMEGKTVGKMAMGLRVISNEFFLNSETMDYRLTLSENLLRALGYVSCYLTFGTLFVVQFSSEDRRGAPDQLSNSRTVSDNWLAQTLDNRQHAQEVVQIDINSLAS